MENNLEHSIKFIENKVGKNNGFTSPKGYFTEVENRVSLKLSEEVIATKSGFNTPQNYFNKLEDTILEKVASTQKETKVIPLKTKILKVVPFAAAASILLFIGLNTFIFNTDEVSLNSLTDNDIEYWLSTIEINTSDIELVLENEILNENDFSLTNIKNESIEDYLNSIDNTTLLYEIN